MELELFAPARERMPWLEELLHGRTPAEVGRELAAAEPAEAPAPGAEAAWSWRVPGPGGHVRHLVAGEAAGDAESRRDWFYGFFLRCCEEAAAARHA